MNKRKKIFLTVFVLLLTLATLVTSTFAWFTIAQNASVEQLSLSVSQAKELQISLDGVNFKDNLTGDEVKAVIGNRLELTNVTTMDLETFYSSYASDSLSAPNVDYLALDVWFRTNDEDLDGLYLTNNITPNYNYEVARNNILSGTYCYSEGRSFAAKQSFIYAEGDVVAEGETRTYYAADAVRIGVKEQLVDIVPLVEADTRTSHSKFIYDISEDEERGFGVEYGQLDLLKKRIDSTITAPVNRPDTVYALTQMVYNYNAVNNNSLCASFLEGTDGYRYAKVTVYVWLEGWDADCIDAILTDEILLQLYFRCAEIAQ